MGLLITTTDAFIEHLTNYVPGRMLNVLHGFPHLILTMTFYTVNIPFDR